MVAKIKMTPAPTPDPRKLECFECGALATASCDCHASYVPAGERARKAVEANPGLSNRAIAEKTGLSEPTVRRSRKSGASTDAPEKRTGRDGKKQKATKAKTGNRKPKLEKMPNVACEIIDESNSMLAGAIIEGLVFIDWHFARQGPCSLSPDKVADILLDQSNTKCLPQIMRSMNFVCAVKEALDQRNTNEPSQSEPETETVH
jgi:hypothetical protein